MKCCYCQNEVDYKHGLVTPQISYHYECLRKRFSVKDVSGKRNAAEHITFYEG